MYPKHYFLVGALVFLGLCLRTLEGQSINFGFGVSSNNGNPTTTRRPPPHTVRGPVAPPTAPPTGSTPSKSFNRAKRSNETQDLISMLMKKIEEISRKQDHYQNILLNAIKEPGAQEALGYSNTQSPALIMEHVSITSNMEKEITKEIVEPTTLAAVNAKLSENSTDRRIGFSVRKAAGTNPSTFLLQASNIPISFQDTLSNVGNGWTGLVFKAPVAGHYFFTFHAQTSETGDFTMALRKNGQYQVTAYGGKSGYQWGSNSALLSLSQGDSIYLTLDEGEIYEHPNNEAYTTLTGFLVFQ